MASPAVVGTPSESATVSDATTHTIARPTGVAGQLTILIFSYDGGSAVNVTAFSEETYTQFFRQDDTTSYGVIGYYRWEDATEDTSFDITTDDLEKSASILFSISGAENPATQLPEATTALQTPIGTHKDPPAISPRAAARTICSSPGSAMMAKNSTTIRGAMGYGRVTPPPRCSRRRRVRVARLPRTSL